MSDAAIGHNSQRFIDLAAVLDGDLLRMQMEAQNADAIQRAGELLAGFGRFTAALVDGKIPDEDTLNKVAAFEKQIRDTVKVIEQQREAVKAPINAAAAVVQGFFKARLADPLLEAAGALQKHRTAYLQDVEKRRRDAMAAEAKARQAEADRLAAEAIRTGNAEKMDEALAADQKAADMARTAAHAKPADLTRTRSDLGVTSSLRTVLKFRVTDKTKVPLDLMAIVDAAVMGRAKTVKDPVIEQPVPGIEFYRDSVAR